MTTRPASDGDLASLARLHKASFAQAWDETALRQLIASGACAEIAELNGEIIGFVLFRTASDEAEILTIAVAPEARRSGWGRALVRQAASEAGAAGAVRMFLEVGADNTPARALYAGLGFAPAGHRKAYYRAFGKPPEDALILSAPLPLSGLGNGGLVD